MATVKTQHIDGAFGGDRRPSAEKVEEYGRIARLSESISLLPPGIPCPRSAVPHFSLQVAHQFQELRLRPNFKLAENRLEMVANSARRNVQFCGDSGHPLT